MALNIYYDKDADLARLENKTVAVLGYGSQGHAHAQNLANSGVSVVVGLRQGSPSWAKAEAAGLRVLTPADAAAEADVVMMTLPDESTADIYHEHVAPHLKSGKYLEAAAEFQSMVDQSPSYDFGFYMMGLSFLQMGKSDEALKNLLKAIELNGDKFEYHHAVAKGYFEKKQYAKAVATLKTAEPLAADSRTEYALYQLRGMSYSALEKWSDSIDDLEKAKTIRPSNAVLDRLGLAYYNLGHNDKALPALKAALKLSPDNAAILARLTTVQLNLGAETRDDSGKKSYYDAALVTAEKYRSVRPDSLDAQNLVGRAALGGKNFEKAGQAFRKVLAIKSDHCYAMANLGKTYIATSQWADAQSILEDAVKCAPRMAVVYEGLGFVLQKQKQLPEAITAYEKALEIKPSSSIRKAIEICQGNIQIEQDNRAMDELKLKQEEAERIAQEDFEREKAKREEWEKKGEDD